MPEMTVGQALKEILGKQGHLAMGPKETAFDAILNDINHMIRAMHEEATDDSEYQYSNRASTFIATAPELVKLRNKNLKNVDEASSVV
jgi:hypothetical protein